MEKIIIPDWMKKEMPNEAYMCDFINILLEEGNGSATIAELASALNKKNVDLTYNKVHNAIRNQVLGVQQ